MKVKRSHTALTLLVCLGLVFSWAAFLPGQTALAEENAAADSVRYVYTDFLAGGWRDFSWGTVDLANTDPVHNGTQSIKASLDGFTGLYLFYPGFSPAGYSSIRFYIHGGSAGGQQLALYFKFIEDGSEVFGPRVPIPAPPANQWTEVNIPLASLGADTVPITSLIIQSETGATLPAFYVDDIAFVSDTAAAAPTITVEAVKPRAVQNDGTTKVRLTAQVSDAQGDIDQVFIDGTSFGLGIVALHDNGLFFDGSAGDGTYGAVFTIPDDVPAGEYTLPVVAVDLAGNQTIAQAGALAVLAQPGGSIPSGLPNRIGWGTNAWTATAGSDWQGNSGVPWDYNYTTITYSWYMGEYPGNYIGDFVTQAWNRDEVPVVMIYMMLGLANCGESGSCYAQALQDETLVTTYIDALTQAVAETSGSQPVVIGLEPDFIGFMQQYTNSPSSPESVQPDNPASVPVALNVSGYENNLAGFGKYIVDLVHDTAGNALAAPMVSWWSTEDDAFSVVPEQVMVNATRSADFTLQMGGEAADLLMVEWGDRDAGSGLVPFWDVTNNELPRPTRANLWENILSASTGKRLLLWRVPAGNMNLDNTLQHYQDNRAAYAFSHPRDLFDSGVIGVMFGAGIADMTQVWTDGDFIKNQAAIAYAAPDVPDGLSVAGQSGAVVTLRWNPNTEPDMWGYIVEFQSTSGGDPVELNVGRSNSANLLILQPGDYTARVRAYDAMNNQSGFTSSVSFTTTQSVGAFLPLVE